MELRLVGGKNILFFFRACRRYFFIMFIFIFFTLISIFIAPNELPKKETVKKEVISTENPDLDGKRIEKKYQNVFQSLPGDFFRVGVMATSKKKEVVEVFVRSSFQEPSKIGEWELLPSEEGEYKELLFSTAYRYDDIIFRLRSPLVLEEGKKWDDSAVFIDSFSLSRIELKNNFSIKNLQPTLFGISALRQEVLFSEPKKKTTDNPQWIFQAKGDFLQAIEFSGEIKNQGRQKYTFELFRFDQNKKEKKDKVLQKKYFIPDELNDLRIASGNYQIPFSFPLEFGGWYVVNLVQEETKEQKNSFVLTSLATDTDSSSVYAESGDLAIHIGKRTQGGNGRNILDRALLEDIGKERLYSFSLHNEPVDYTNLFDASSSVFFDPKKKVVLGSQKNGEFFSYKFDTIYPFDRFVLNVLQKGNDEKEIKLEYSFDNAFWKEISFTQEKGGPQRFSLSLLGDTKNHVVYVRAAYNGEEKKSGFFALEDLSIHASVPKP